MGKDHRGDDSLLSTPQSPSEPSGKRPLSHQVAGHHKKKGTTSNVFLECDDGTILKPIQPPPKGHREAEFYQTMFAESCTNPVLTELRRFLPYYHGLWTSRDGVTYIQLEDITKMCTRPCIMDIKMGPITYDPLASAEKQASERAKYPPLEKVGFQILGFRVYPSTAKDSIFYDRTYGRSLTEDEVLYKGLGQFFGLGDELKTHAITSTLDQLESIRQWFLRQRQLCFYASSLLLVYDADSAGQVSSCHSQDADKPHPKFTPDSSKNASHSCSNNSSAAATDDNHDVVQNKTQIFSTADGIKSNCIVKMIDFTHVFPTAEQDDNYLYGLNSLINYLQRLLKLR